MYLSSYQLIKGRKWISVVSLSSNLYLVQKIWIELGLTLALPGASKCQDRFTFPNSADQSHQKNDSTVKGRGSPPHGEQALIHSLIYSFYSIQWLSEPGTVVDHGSTFHCPALPDSPEKHLPGAQSSERRGIPLQVTKASPYCMVSATPQVRGEGCGVGGEAVHPSGNSFLVGRWQLRDSSVTIPLASDEEAYSSNKLRGQEEPQVRWGEEPNANSLQPFRIIFFKYVWQYYREEGKHGQGKVWKGGMRQTPPPFTVFTSNVLRHLLLLTHILRLPSLQKVFLPVIPSFLPKDILADIAFSIPLHFQEYFSKPHGLVPSESASESRSGLVTPPSLLALWQGTF